MKIEFELQGVPEPLNVIQRKYRNHHKRHAYYLSWYEQVYFSTLRMRPPHPFKRARLTIAAHLPPRKFRDYDGLVASLKPIVDGLKRAQILSDDNYKVTGPWSVTQVADKTTLAGFLKITIEEVIGE